MRRVRTSLRSAALAAMGAALAMLAAAAAAGTAWTTVGAAQLTDTAGTATVRLRWQAEFRELLVCSDGAAVKLGRAALRLRDGTTKPLKLPGRLADADCAPPISLGRNREFESVDVAYQLPAAGGATKLSFAGR